MVQKQTLQSLPDIESLKRLSQSLAMLDAIMSPDRESRYYSFDSKWSAGEMMASMHNRSGDEYCILFNWHGAIMKGFAHESPMSLFDDEPNEVWRGVLESVPGEFQDFLTEPAFEIEATTFCIWRRYFDSSWQVGDIVYPEEDDPDGSEELLSILDGDAATYRKFAKDYFEKRVSLSAVKHIYEHRALTEEIISELNAKVSMDELQADIEEIGYPI